MNAQTLNMLKRLWLCAQDHDLQLPWWASTLYGGTLWSWPRWWSWPRRIARVRLQPRKHRRIYVQRIRDTDDLRLWLGFANLIGWTVIDE